MPVQARMEQDRIGKNLAADQFIFIGLDIILGKAEIYVSKKFDEEGISRIYFDVHSGKIEWSAMPPNEVSNGLLLNNWVKAVQNN